MGQMLLVFPDTVIVETLSMHPHTPAAFVRTDFRFVRLLVYSLLEYEFFLLVFSKVRMVH